MKSLIVVLMLLVSSQSFAKEYCFSEDQMGQIVVDLEKGQYCEKQIEAYIDLNSEKEKQIELLGDQLKVTEEKFLEAERKNNTDKKIVDERDIARLKEIEQLKKPRWSSIFGSFGVGFISGVLVILLL